jgi:hypothetical protein
LTYALRYNHSACRKAFPTSKFFQAFCQVFGKFFLVLSSFSKDSFGGFVGFQGVTEPKNFFEAIPNFLPRNPGKLAEGLPLRLVGKRRPVPNDRKIPWHIFRFLEIEIHTRAPRADSFIVCLAAHNRACAINVELAVPAQVYSVPHKMVRLSALGTKPGSACSSATRKGFSQTLRSEFALCQASNFIQRAFSAAV